ncbi:hypothetical protein Tco_1308634, partial [Tanacetum coccineum]
IINPMEMAANYIEALRSPRRGLRSELKLVILPHLHAPRVCPQHGIFWVKMGSKLLLNSCEPARLVDMSAAPKVRLWAKLFAADFITSLYIIYFVFIKDFKSCGDQDRGFRGAPRPLLPAMLLAATTNPSAGQEHPNVAANLGLYREDGCVKWLQELALHNAGIETFSFRDFCHPYDVKDVALLVKNCSKSLVSLNFSTSYIDDLGDAFSHAVKLEYFSRALYGEDMEYSTFKFPSTIRSLGIYDFRKPSLPFIYPILNQLRELNFTYLGDVEKDCQCFFIKRCPNVEVLDTDDVCGDKGLQVISQLCKKLRRLRFRYCSGTHMGLIAVAQGCRKLEFLHIQLTNISNEALECIGTNLKNLHTFYLIVCKDEDDVETISPLDSGFQAMLIGCTKLERLSITLYEEYLTDVGLGFIGKYGINLRLLSLSSIGGSDEGLRALSKGCPRLRKFRIQGCDFSEQAIAKFFLNVYSLRYLWVLDKDHKIVSALTHPNFGSSTMQAQGPYATLSEKLDT